MHAEKNKNAHEPLESNLTSQENNRSVLLGVLLALPIVSFFYYLLINELSRSFDPRVLLFILLLIAYVFCAGQFAAIVQKRNVKIFLYTTIYASSALIGYLCLTYFFAGWIAKLIYES